MTKRVSAWTWLAPLVAGTIVFAAFWPLASDQDLYLHLKTGERIEASHGPVRTDGFGYLTPGAPEETHSWLSQWVLFRVHRAGGEPALRVLNGLCLAILFLAVFQFVLLRSGSAPAAGLAVALAVLAQSQVHSFRPQIFAQALAAILLFKILAPPWSKERGLAAIALSFLWANVHGSSLLAPALIAIRTRSLKWTGAALAVQALNPKGPGLWLDTAAVFDTGRALGIGEWVSATYPPILWISAAGAVWLLLKKGTGDWTALASLFLCWLSFTGHRHIAWLFFPIAASASALGASIALSAANAWLGIAVVLWGGRFWESPRATPPIPRTTDFLEKAQIEGPCFNYPGWGSYLVYRLYPRLKVAHTMRLLTHRDAFLWEKEQWDKFGGMTLEAVTQKWPATRIAVLPSRYPIPFLADPSQWAPIYVNDQAAVLLKRSAENEENWRRVEAYYKEANVPFDRAKGFLPKTVNQSRPEWLERQQEPGGWGRWPKPKVFEEANQMKTENWKRWLTWEGIGAVSKPARFYWKDGPSPQGTAQP